MNPEAARAITGNSETFYSPTRIISKKGHFVTPFNQTFGQLKGIKTSRHDDGDFQRFRHGTHRFSGAQSLLADGLKIGRRVGPASRLIVMKSFPGQIGQLLTMLIAPFEPLNKRFWAANG